MKLAVNYSNPLIDLLEDGQVDVDCLKCPAWPDLVTMALETRPVYVHFPLKVGTGRGEVMDTETNLPVDWDKIETLLARTNTPLVNVHLLQPAADFPDIPRDTNDPAHVEMLTEAFLRDLAVVVRRFGREMVVAENVHNGLGQYMRPVILSQVIRQVVEEAGCGFLLDISHARLAARHLGVEAREYINALPVEHIREIHVTGMQMFMGDWVERVKRVGGDMAVIQPFIGKLLDHLPMTGADWDFLAWAMEQIKSGKWRTPWVISFEYGGIGFPWEAITDGDALLEQVPRLYEMVRPAAHVLVKPGTHPVYNH